LFLDSIHDYYLNMTRKRSWNEPYFLTFNIIGNQFNNDWFYCYQMFHDIALVYKQKFANFVDFGDVYMSFIFNLLSNSLQIKVSAEAMVNATAQHDTVTFVRNAAKIARVTLDFSSYQSTGSALNPSSPLSGFNRYFAVTSQPMDREVQML
jgi:hypothetical protein